MKYRPADLSPFCKHITQVTGDAIGSAALGRQEEEAYLSVVKNILSSARTINFRGIVDAIVSSTDALQTFEIRGT